MTELEELNNLVELLKATQEKKRKEGLYLYKNMN